MKIVYTAIMGDYDNPLPLIHKSPDWTYLFFTDSPDLEVPGWEMVRVTPTDNPRLQAKEIKILAHKHLPPHEVSVWIDGSIQIKRSPDNLYEPHKQAELVLVPHEDRHDIWEEGDKILELGKETWGNVTAQLDQYKYENFGGSFRDDIYMGGILIRKPTFRVNKIMDEWMTEVRKWSTRDQLSLPYVLWRNRANLPKISKASLKCFRWFLDCKPHKINNPNIFYLTPYGYNKKIGDRLNYEISLLPEDSWIVIRDMDTMFLYDYVGNLLRDVINEYGDTTDLFGAYTNRLGLDYQLHGGEISDNFDIKYHHAISQDRVRRYYKQCTTIDRPIAGFFMMFPKRTWEKHKFQSPIIDITSGKYFDWQFSESVLNNGGNVRLIEGLYIFHTYRLGKDKKDVKHLLP